ncbi:hypothetical protein L211DRAFT_161008 [Terfezia boudieri ATCC MYA-4762]|uniref:Mid2 domain-containing protein n=1 Tax=Terfezia boudieri ATCC MYA-4762 TaxID=1051890 RepID=A0A3N4LNI2_9PEZI|nr:hypothetical protein L211DRAFT_161008 [Terfezia boudieri ATCC MYA-4762]
MLRSRAVVFFWISLLTLVSARVVDRRQVTSITSSAPVNPSTVTHIATPKPNSTLTTTTGPTATKSSSTSTAIPTDDPPHYDDSEEYIPPPLPDAAYFQDEGAGGTSTGFINISIGAQAGIIIAIVLVGLAIMGGCIWFWNKKQAEWKLALERRRTLRASRVAAAKATGISTGKKGPNKKGNGKGPSGLSKETKADNNGSTSSLASTEVQPAEPEVERSQFDVMTPTESENPSWWKKVLPRKK